MASAHGPYERKGLKVLVDRKLLPSLKTLNVDFCEHCVFGKQARQKFKAGRHNSKGILDYIHSDVWGPAPIVSYGGSSYFVSFIDDYSRKVWIYVLKRKADVFNTFKQFRVWVEKSTNKTIKCLRTNNGGEFTLGEFNDLCKSSGNKRELSTPYIPKQIGVAKRKNQTIMEVMKAITHDHDLLMYLWEKEAKTAIYVQNRMPHRALGNKTP